jgi:hypothetical protein
MRLAIFPELIAVSLSEPAPEPKYRKKLKSRKKYIT